MSFASREEVEEDMDTQADAGRNRRAACKMAGVEPTIRYTDSEDPTKFVLSANIHYRYLSAGQRAMVAAQLADMRQGARTDLGQICTMSAAGCAFLRAHRGASRAQWRQGWWGTSDSKSRMAL